MTSFAILPNMDSFRHGWKSNRVRLEGHENLLTANATELDQAIVRGPSRSPGARRSVFYVRAPTIRKMICINSAVETLSPVAQDRQDAHQLSRSQRRRVRAPVIKDATFRWHCVDDRSPMHAPMRP
jgi:hypothetical protein